ncbi:MAG: DegT/DnrJ/EryC1/StrS family aminotransferase [Nitrososphaerales archaeon]
MIPINRPILDKKEEEAVLNTLRSGELTNPTYQGGKNVAFAERALAEYLGVKHVVLVNSGTAALQAALLALDIGEGDEVLLPSFTFVATANAVLSVNAKPIFVDIRLDDYCIDPEDLERKITKRCKAVIPVHLYGYPANMQRILEVASKHNLFIIEDAAQSLGATYRSKQTGSFGDLGCFSFYPSKVITCGEGGAVATNSDELANRLRMLRNHGFDAGGFVKRMGLNLRLNEVSAAILSSQLKKLNYFLEQRRKNAEELSRMLDGCGAVLPSELEGRRSNWYLYTIRVMSRDKVLERLHKSEVGAAIYYKTPIHLYPHYHSLLGDVKLPNTEQAAAEVLSLPVHPALTKAELRHIAAAVKSALSK